MYHMHIIIVAMIMIPTHFTIYKGLLINYVFKVSTEIDFYNNFVWSTEKVVIIPFYRQGD